MKILATYNIKGGVGKTAAAVNLAHLAALEGHRTLIWDLDPQGAATFFFRIKPKVKGGAKRLVRGKGRLDSRIRGTDYEPLDLLPADFSYRHMDLLLDAVKRGTRRLAERLEPLGKRYDYLFLDCAPSISLVSEAVFVAADCLLVPTIPTTLAVRTVRRLAKHLARKQRPVQVLPFFSMVDRRKALHREICDDATGKPYEFLQTRIPYSSVVERMGVHRAPLETYARTSEAARAFRSLWEEIRARLSGGEPTR